MYAHSGCSSTIFSTSPCHFILKQGVPVYPINLLSKEKSVVRGYKPFTYLY